MEFKENGSIKLPKTKEILENIDMEKCKRIVNLLFEDYSEKRGVFNKFRFPPEYNLPKNMKRGSNEQLLFVTLTVSLDYMRDADKLWKQSYDSWLNGENKWIFEPKKVIEKGEIVLVNLFKKIKDQRPNKDGGIWFDICKKLTEFDSNVFNLLEKFDFDAVKIGNYLEDNKKDFPFLSGKKIKPLWLRMINDAVGISLKNIEKIPIPLDVHTVRLSLKILFNESFDGDITNKIRSRINKGWEKVLEGGNIYSLQLDEPLWMLGKHKLFDKFMKEHRLS